VAIGDAPVTTAAHGLCTRPSVAALVGIIGAMSRLHRLPLQRLPLNVRAPLGVLCLLLALWSGVPLLLHPLQMLAAARYSSTVSDPRSECPGDPVPAPGGCWSSVRARVATLGGELAADGSSVYYAVLDVAGRDPVREDFASGDGYRSLAVGQAVSVRYWGADIAEVVVPVAPAAAAKPTAPAPPPVVMPTRDNPAYRTQFPVSDLVLLVPALIGFLLFGLPLTDDVQAWRRRRAVGEEAMTAARLAISTPGYQRGLARYGIRLAPEPAPAPATAAAPPAEVETTLTGQSARPAPAAAAPAAPPPAPAAQAPAPQPPAAAPAPPVQPAQPPGTRPGGAGWNIRVR